MSETTFWECPSCGTLNKSNMGHIPCLECGSRNTFEMKSNTLEIESLRKQLSDYRKLIVQLREKMMLIPLEDRNCEIYDDLLWILQNQWPADSSSPSSTKEEV